MNTHNNNKVEEYMDAYAECGYFNGSVLVAYKGSILISKGYGLANIECHTPNTPRTKFRIASLTKAFTSMAIMQLEEKGYLKVSDSDIHDLPKKRLAHYGDVEGFVSYFARYVEDDLTVIVLSNTMIAPVQEINNTLAKIVFGYDISAPVIPAFIKDPNKQEYAGDYARKDSDNEKISLTFEDDRLYLSSNGTDRYPVNPVFSQDHAIDYVAEYMDERLAFIRNDDKKVNQVIYTNANGDANLYERSV
jgi:hypothetical protein